MRRGAYILAGALLVTASLAGCLGGDDGGSAGDGASDVQDERSLSVTDRGTASERAQASVASSSGGITYDDLVIAVDGEPYQFGPEASFLEATYSVNGVSDGNADVEDGQVIQIPAAGTVELTFRDGENGAVWDRYTATVPDEDAPSSPTPQAPANGASGVSRSPTFDWAPVADPSGVTYSLEISIDRDFSQDLVVQSYEDISRDRFKMSEDDQLQPAQTYYWHVRATDGAGNTGAWSPTWSFTTSPR